MRRSLGLVVLLTVPLALCAQQRDVRPRPPLDVKLDRLVGDWTMTGTVLGKPVEYRMDARRTLQSRYVELHMIDVSRPPAYEARVFIGTDTTDRGYIAHWLDNFGASFSVPHATGTARGDTISLLFKYSNGDFRDTFVYSDSTDSWYLRMESASGAKWKLFGEYQVKRRPPAAAAPARP